MSFTNISGVPFDSITGISGIHIDVIRTIFNDIRIPPRITCTEVMFGYSTRQDEVCGSRSNLYYLDRSTSTTQSLGTLYLECGDRLAPFGFYSNGSEIYEWDGNELITISSCRR